MKKTLFILGLAAALVLPAGVAFAQSHDVATDDTPTCQMLEGAETRSASAQRQASLGDDASYGEPGDCALTGDVSSGQAIQLRDRTHTQLRTADQIGMAGDGVRPADWSCDGDGLLGHPAD